jgi:hypothetical protein
MIDAVDMYESIDSSDAADATDPIERIEPTEPTDSTEPLEQIDSSESSDHRDHLEPRRGLRMVRIVNRPAAGMALHAGRRTLLCFGLALVLALALVAPQASIAAAPASADSLSSPQLSIAVGASQSVGVAVPIVVSGNAEPARSLYLYVDSDDFGCQYNPANEAGIGSGVTALSAASGAGIGPGNFTSQFSYVPPLTGSYELCAYVDASPADAPDATAYTTFEAEQPAASLAVHVSASAYAGSPATVSVSGQSAVARSLYVYVGPDRGACGVDPATESGGEFDATALTGESGSPVGPGTFSVSRPFTPRAAAAYLICAYVDYAASGPPDTLSTLTFQARVRASLAIRVSPRPAVGVVSTVIVSGSAGLVRRLYVYASLTAVACEAFPAEENLTVPRPLTLADGSRTVIGPGKFLRRYRYRVPTAGHYRICGYLDLATSDRPDARASLSFSNHGAGVLPPAVPAGNCTTNRVPASVELSAINRCRAFEGVGPLRLPDNWSSLTVPEQLLVVINLERIGRGLAPVIGLSATLDRFAQLGAEADADPGFPSGPFGGGSIWAENSDVLGADLGWMYDDGFADGNIDCKRRGDQGCWGHRKIVLSDASDTPLVGGGGYVHGRSYNSYTFEMLYGYRTSGLVFRWAGELRHFAHRPQIEPLVAS